MGISVCVLCFSDYLDLAKRCIGSIFASEPWRSSVPVDLRMAANAPSKRLLAYLTTMGRAFADHVRRVVLYLPQPPYRLKYPVMRRMFHDSQHPLGEWAMWFDDDSYLESPSPTWWEATYMAAAQADMLGQRWVRFLRGRQWDWIRAQPWFDPSVGPPKMFRGRPCVEFCTGGWWMLRESVIRRLNWPIPELRHFGGDMLLGEMCRHFRLRVIRYDQGVRINADWQGRHSKAPRRGLQESSEECLIGENYTGQPLPVEHQHFQCEIMEF